MKLEDLHDHTKTVTENNEHNNENTVKHHYEYWIKFKNQLFAYLHEIIKIGKINAFIVIIVIRKRYWWFKYLWSFFWI
ncbi:hypothetical protein [Spiroplasma sp. SV19]|uniref:hypothetical protein n=1 Tax=Spiroplasma sp. SV19 TaxID=2570468 RepID=UPI0024B636A2|nr:hypothetical protein [Spiroplasma sp. SV19]